MIFLLALISALSVNKTKNAEYLSILREDEKGIEILWQAQLVAESLPDYRYPPLILGTRKVSSFPLPGVEFLVGIPQKGEVSLSAVGEEKRCIAWPPPEFDFDGTPLPSPLPFLKAEKLAEIAGIETLRDCRFARIHLFPLSWTEKGYEIYLKVRLQLNYSQPPKIVPKEDYFDEIYERVFLNGEKAKFYKLEDLAEKSPNPFLTSLNWVKIKIDSTRIYKITAKDLRRIGLNPEIINPRTIKIYSVGKRDTLIEIPIYVKGEEDERFDETDYIIFYGERFPSLYTNFNYYWLTFGLSPGLRMKHYFGNPLPGQPVLATGLDSLRWEIDLLCPARSGLLWVWEYFPKAPDEERAYTKNLIIPQGKVLKELSLGFFARSESLRVRFFLNSNLLDSFVQRRTIPPEGLIYKKELAETISETLRLTFSFYGAKAQDIYLDNIGVIYEKDLTSPQKVNLLSFWIKERGNYNILATAVKNPSFLFEIIPDTITGICGVKMIEGAEIRGETVLFGKTFYYPAKFILTNDSGISRPLSLELRRPFRLHTLPSFDYLVIAPDEFRSGAQILSQYRENNISDRPRAKSCLVTLSEIYDEYGFGREEPDAIKKFLKEKRPYYCVFIGDATYDYRGILPYKKYPGVPTYEYGYDFSSDPYTYQAFACDAWYADLEGSGSSPDLILSRLPVRTEDELRLALKKIKDFERRKSPYRNLFLLVGDDEFNGYYDQPDNIRYGAHIRQCEGISNLLGEEFEPVKIYLTEYPYPLPRDKPEAREALISTLNQGVGVMAYFGHGWTAQLTHERLLDIPSLTKLKNTDQPFFGFFGSCGVGKFDDTESECLAEELQRMEGGAIATIGASKATSSSTNYEFAQALFLPLILFPQTTIGKAFLSAWYMEQRYHLFGDGATSLPRFSGSLPLSLEPETLKTGRVVTVRTDTGGIEEGNYEITAYSPKFFRYYRSHLVALNYTLPGEILFQGRGKICGDQINARFLFPKLPYPEVRYVENGSYTLVPNSARIRVYALGKDTGMSYLARDLPFRNETITSPDTSGPELKIFYQGQEMKEEGVVEREFILEGEISDESGINILPSYPLGFYKNNPSDFFDLRDKIQFDFSSYQRANFRWPLKISEPCSLVFILYDNLGNKTKKSFRLYPLSEESLLIKDNLFVSTGSSGYFTFYLSLPATLTIRVYTLSGRFLVEILTFGTKGFNRVYFDGRNLPKGIYLYQISAETLDNKKARVLDKLLLR
jgi:hypothetical protein